MAEPNRARTERSQQHLVVRRVPEPAQQVPDPAQQEVLKAAEPTAVLAQRALAAPGTLRPADGRRLQRALGNRGLTALAQRSMAQRSMAQRSPRVQAKLRVGPAHDSFEQEADRMAERALAGAPPQMVGEAAQGPQPAPPIRRVPAAAQRAAEEGDGGFAVGAGFEGELARASGGGRPLPADLRQRVEPVYGASFEGVRVHAGADSAALAESIQAKAFTHGRDIHFNAGEYNPDSSVGQRLIAHELTHVVQQGAASETPVQRAQEDAPADVAVQRSPDGVIQREGKRVNSLIAFWESQKVLNAPKKPGAKPSGGGQEPQAEIPIAVGGNEALLKDALAPPEKSGGGGDGAVASGPHAATPGAGGGDGQNLMSSGRSDTVASGPHAATPGAGGGVLKTPSAGSAKSGSGKSDSGKPDSGVPDSSPDSASDWSSSVDSFVGLPLGQQFPTTTQLLKVGSSYHGEEANSLRFLTTKVFQMGESAFFGLTPEKRKNALSKIGWTEAEITDLEVSKMSKVKYLNTEEERADYKLVLGDPIKQGVSTDPWDTSGMFANGVGLGHAIFVMDPAGAFYAGRHKIAAFHHSSFLGGAPAASAGTMQVVNGKLKTISPKSGHYIPKAPQFRLALAELKDHGVDLSNTMAKPQDDTGAFLPEVPALDFLGTGPKPVVQPLSSGASPSSATPTSTTTSSSLQSWSGGSGGFGGFVGGRSGTPPDFDMSEEYLLNQAAGGFGWKEKLKALGLEGTGNKWAFRAHSSLWDASHSDLVKILNGTMKPEDLVF